MRVGEQVVPRSSSDVAEELHVHGYALEAAVPAGGSVDIPLTAGIRASPRWSCTTRGRSCSS